uniref:Uncharacterized protein n=1 Tax=uncultured Alphaproteobacteria bacterium TaxID=91750 RepID=A0A6G8F2V7_9PROT|nr:hypothetical protein PlAlph_5470 [uncultured Alphaproteobacteria bacterium]
MGTLLKYIFYIVLVLLIYIVAKDIYDGKINQDTTVQEVGETVGTQSKQIINNSVEAVKEAAD